MVGSKGGRGGEGEGVASGFSLSAVSWVGGHGKLAGMCIGVVSGSYVCICRYMR